MKWERTAHYLPPPTPAWKSKCVSLRAEAMLSDALLGLGSRPDNDQLCEDLSVSLTFLGFQFPHL